MHVHSLVTIKRLAQTGKVRLEFPAPSAGAHNCKLFLICDAYTGCDQEYELGLNVKESLDDDDDDDDEDDEDDKAAMDVGAN